MLKKDPEVKASPRCSSVEASSLTTTAYTGFADGVSRLTGTSPFLLFQNIFNFSCFINWFILNPDFLLVPQWVGRCGGDKLLTPLFGGVFRNIFRDK